MGFLDKLFTRTQPAATSAKTDPDVPQQAGPESELDSAAAAQSPSLRYDGLYQSAGLWEGAVVYLRFYDDGTVLSVSSSGRPDQVAAWFNKAHPSSSMGKYDLHGSRLEFTTVGKDDTFDYAGSMSGDEIVLTEHSHRNGFATESVFHFVEVPGMQP